MLHFATDGLLNAADVDHERTRLKHSGISLYPRHYRLGWLGDNYNICLSKPVGIVMMQTNRVVTRLERGLVEAAADESQSGNCNFQIISPHMRQGR